MKKNFFKKLSFVLASAMIVSSIAPAAGAFAASKPALNSKSKTFYLDVDGKNEFDFNLTVRKTGWKYAWSSSDEDIVDVDNKGVAVATGAGNATISCAITDKDGDAVVKPLVATIYVRDNIKTVEIVNVPTDNKVAVATEYDFNSKIAATVSGAKSTKIAVRRWSVEGEGATIDATTGKFTATKAGEYKVTVNAFQSKTSYNTWLTSKAASLVTATASTTVTVLANMETPQQVDLDTVKVPFTAATADVAKNLTLYKYVGTSKVKVNIVKKIEMDADNKVATVDLYGNFDAEATYEFNYPEMTAVKFVAAKADLASVNTLDIVTTTAVTGVDTKIEVVAKDKNGVDITAGIGEFDGKSTSKVSFATNTPNKATISENKVRMYTTNDTAEVTVTIHTQKWNTTTGLEEGNITATKVITAVDKATAVAGTVKSWTLAKKLADVDFTKTNTKLSVSDLDYTLYVELKSTTGTTEGSIKSTDLAEAGNFAYTSSDANVLIVDKNGKLYPVKSGSASVIITYGTGNNAKVVDSILVNILAERKAATLSATANKTSVVSNSDAVNEKVVFTLEVKDNLDDVMALTGVSVEAINDPAKKAGVGVMDYKAADKTYTFSAVNLEAGTYIYKIKANTLERLVSVVVAKPTTVTPTSWALELSSTDIDSKYVDKDITLTVSLFGVDGVKNKIETVSGGAFNVYVIAPDGSKTKTDGTFTIASGVSGSAVSKVKTGVYTVVAERTVDGSVYTSSSPVRSAATAVNFTVKDTQVTPVLEVTTKKSTKTDIFDAIDECFNVKLDGVDVTAAINEDKEIVVRGDINGTQVYVEKLIYTQTFSTGAVINHEVKVDTTIVKAAK